MLLGESDATEIQRRETLGDPVSRAIRTGRKNCKNVCHRGMNSARAIAFYGNVVSRLSSCSVAPTYDPAIWLAGERLRGNSKEIGLLLKVVHDDDDDDIDDDMHA